jgi:hypothetical protein
LQRHEAEKFAVLGAGRAGLRGKRTTPLAHHLKMLRLDHAAADQQQQQCRGDADEEHIAPAEATDQRVDLAADDAAHRPAGHHNSENLGTVNLSEGFGYQRDSDNDFGSGTNPGKEAIDPELEGRVRQSLQPGEYAIDQDANRQSSNAPDIVGNDAEQKAAEGPAE